ncbi:hypothetical protein A2303_06380 [Candidatus Falkowbacteria bacterium RIFOXYB2_FULL_47_14]|uniref:Type II secretion system protein GspG C-terminal domain-containing protein n=1 Tax=Candidatus Falkowbacteria bacterium RIFOXYA2_FULL_47_19 TaxID=1797994 RepID=A0A1F5SJ72_9BACT|nr:MAG: hypothetical protein A2227_06440 [Candidatus Falkowbacteria bacterium RIFOXYA2_FULL_47_19]OGF35727.1 MAG: hypothetical protein A2468_05115 [Candidatus Falkowbacteria bacterium RIFOXYC2_FULL_46_15]OGF43968.1 MAG: hypothetical protein A2303_06380 [Candidatus Falkowbacteria bacterium RIFOXYB2_FULL_47_14]
MEIKRQMDPKKKKIIQAAAGVLIFLLVAVFTGFIVNYAQKSARDTQRLSDIAGLRFDLELFYHKYDKFPLAVLTAKKEDKEACSDNLCLDYVPADPLSGAAYAYTPCADPENVNCGENIGRPLSYMLIYTLETDSIGLFPGNHFASPKGVCADPSCLPAR